MGQVLVLKRAGQKVISPRCEMARSIQSGGTVLFVMIACNLCQNAMPFSSALLGGIQ